MRGTFSLVPNQRFQGAGGQDVRTLSGGEAGRTHLARVFAQRTPLLLLLLDEPTAALDILHQEQTLTRTYARQGAAVVVVLHDLDVAASYSDRLVFPAHD